MIRSHRRSVLLAPLLALLGNAVLRFPGERDWRPVSAMLTGLAMGAIAGLFIWNAGRPRTWRRLYLRRYGLPVSSVQRPERVLGDSVRVLQLEQAQVTEQGVLTLRSLGVYTEGFVVHFQLSDDREEPVSVRKPWWPQLVVDVCDDTGGRYASWGGGARGRLPNWAVTMNFHPALAPVAEALRLDVVEIRWEARNFKTATRWLTYVQPGPWRFRVMLSPEGREVERAH